MLLLLSRQDIDCYLIRGQLPTAQPPCLLDIEQVVILHFASDRPRRRNTQCLFCRLGLERGES